MVFLITFGRKKKGRVSIMTAAREFSGALRWVMLPCLLSSSGETRRRGTSWCWSSWLLLKLGRRRRVPGRGGTAPRCCARIVPNPSMATAPFAGAVVSAEPQGASRSRASASAVCVKAVSVSAANSVSPRLKS